MSFENRYSRAERLLHRWAFRSTGLQIALADIEDQLCRKELQSIEIDRPVFVTALPRAGTTILLNLIVGSGRFASHTYRDMPFVLCPVLWHRLAHSFRADAEERERAHGDGLMVSVDSPEAFEEIVWKAFWPAHYGEWCIEPWSVCDEAEFVEFFRRHVRKILLLRDGGRGDALRYVSKNNLNVARLGCLPALVPGARVLVPVREPLQHAASLLRQHRSFLSTHAEDAFASQYMKGVGHHDFGENLLPVNFDNWMQTDRRADAVGIDFWLEYWIAAYQHVLKQAGEDTKIVSYQSLTRDPVRSLGRIADFLELRADADALVGQASSLHAPRAHGVDEAGVDVRLLDQARQLFAELERAAAF